MKLFNKIKNTVSRIPKKLLVLIAVTLLSVSAIGVVKAEFYPDRPTYDYNKMPLNGSSCVAADDADHNRCGSLHGPVFNSFVNTPSYGDERAFVDARKSENTAAGSYKNVLEDVTTGSKEVVVRMYVHNNANTATNASGQGIAKNTKVRVLVPTGETQSLRTRGYITADNASTVEDTVDFTGSQAFKLQYVPGSATIFNNGPLNNTKISDSVVTTGAPIGYDALNGNLPGCFPYEAVIQIRLKVVVKETPTLKFTKQVRVAGTKEWKKEVNTKPGDKVEWLLTTTTGPSGVNNNIVTRDVAAPNTQLVSGSVKWIDAVQNAAQTDKPLFDGGINVGNYGANSGFYIMYGSTVNGDFDGCEARVRNLAYVKSDQNTEIGDDADVIITKENCTTVTPEYSCDMLTADKVGDRKYDFAVKTTAKNGATLKGFKYSFGDGASTTTTNASTQHTYTKDGKYDITVDATFTVDGQDKTVTGPACKTQVTIAPNVTPVYSCDALTAEKIGDRQYRFTLQYTAKDGAKLKFVNYEYGDNSDKFMTDKLVTEHTYAKDGTYVARAVLTFTVDGVDKEVESDKCSAPVTLTSTPMCTVPGKENLPVNSPECKTITKTTAPTPPNGKLVDTGAGDIAGIFASVTAAGAGLHQMVTRRRNRQ